MARARRADGARARSATRADEALAAVRVERARLAGRREGRRPGRRQGRRDRRRSRRRPRRRCARRWSTRAFGAAGARVVLEECLVGEELLVLRHRRRRAATCALRLGPGPQAAARRRPRARIPAAWARSRRASLVTAALARADRARGRARRCWRAWPPTGTPFRGFPLLRADADRRRPEGDRVQLPLRRSRGPGRAAAARRAAGAAAAGGQHRRPPAGRRGVFAATPPSASCWRPRAIRAISTPGTHRRARPRRGGVPGVPSCASPAWPSATATLVTAGGRVLTVVGRGRPTPAPSAPPTRGVGRMSFRRACSYRTRHRAPGARRRSRLTLR